MDSDDEPESKRRKTELAAQGGPEDGQVAVGQEESNEKTTQLDNELEGDPSATGSVPKDDVLPDHIKVK